jgi:hypothetical protein
MVAVQTTFSEDIPYGYAGMDADGSLSNILSRHLEGATACEFGRPVYQGTADKGVTLVVSAALIGFALARTGLPVTEDRAADTYAPGDTLPVKERGVIWVDCATSANNGAQVYVTAAGAVTATSGGNTAATGWFFEDTISAPGIVRIARR